MFKPVLAAVFAVCFLSSGCNKAKQPIVVGSRNDTEQTVVAEVTAQHLERHLQRKVERRPGLGGELTAYQALTSGEITLYLEYTASIETVILKEPPSADPDIVRERTRSEMLRIAQLDLLDPLGFDNPPVLVVRTADAEKAKVHTLSEAAAGAFRWKLGVSYDFQQRLDALPVINSYKLPMAQGVRGMEAAQLFPALQSGELTMVATNAMDGRLASPDYRVLADDRHAFPPYQACLLVRHDALIEEPQVLVLLGQLAGKLTSEVVRKMDAAVDLDHRRPADVAADFLASVGLK